MSAAVLMGSSIAGDMARRAAVMRSGVPLRAATPCRSTALSLGGHRQSRLTPQAAAGDASGAAASDGPQQGDSSPGKAPRVVSIPAGLPTAGAVFFLAGALKVIIMCFPYSEMAIMMFLQGRADLGLTAALKAIPIALGIAALAKAIVDRELQGRRWVQVAIVTGAIGALCLSRFFFARPRPSPLDPMIRQAVAERATGAAEQQRAAATQRRHLLQQPDAEVGRTMMRQQQEQAEAAGKGR